jgi:hypothetical protein
MGDMPRPQRQEIDMLYPQKNTRKKEIDMLNYTPSVPWYKVYSFLWKISEYKVYMWWDYGIFLHNLWVNPIRRDNIPRVSYFSSILTSIIYLY